MTDLFEDDDELLLEDEFDAEVDASNLVIQEKSLDARRRWEDLMEDRRLKNELEDFVDY